VKSLAFGAKAVLLGRAVLYRLAAAGEERASHVLEAAEVDTTLALIRCRNQHDLSPPSSISEKFGSMPKRSVANRFSKPASSLRQTGAGRQQTLRCLQST
jgi:FMN-dependent dehydrogenase